MRGEKDLDKKLCSKNAFQVILMVWYGMVWYGMRNKRCPVAKILKNSGRNTNEKDKMIEKEVKKKGQGRIEEGKKEFGFSLEHHFLHECS